MKLLRFQFSIIFLIVLNLISYSQTGVFEPKNSIFSLSIGVGSYPGKKSPPDKTIFPNTLINYEYGLFDEVGHGYFGVGTHIGYATAQGNEPITKLKYNANFIYFAPKINYHINFWKITREPMFQKTDIYIGATYGLGYRIQKYTDSNQENSEKTQHYSPNIILGTRFYFNTNTSIGVEILGGKDNCVYLGFGIKI